MTGEKNADTREQITDRAYQIAKSHEQQSGVCSQCCIAGVFEALGVDNNDVIRAATGLADGVGLSGEGHCGALSGGTIAIGYFFGRERKDFGTLPQDITSFLLSKQLIDKFVDKYGSCKCADVQNKLMGRFYNLYDPADMEAAFKNKLLDTCSTVVGEVARMATMLILEEKENRGIA